MPLYKESNGTWMFRMYITDENGNKKQIKRRGFKTKAEAREAERLFEPAQEYIQNEKRKQEEKNNIIFFENKIEEFFFEESKRIKVSTLEGKKYAFDNHITNFFKGKNICEITSMDIQKWQNYMLKKPMKKASINKAYQVLIKYFEFLVNFYNLKINPCKKIQSIREKEDDIQEVEMKSKVCEKDDFKKFIDTFSDEEIIPKVAFEIMYKAGTRRSETRAIKWADVDFTNHTIRINKQLQNIGNKVLLSSTKSNTSNRIVFLCKSLEDSLKELYNSELEKYDSSSIVDLYVLGGINAIGATTLNRYREKHIKLANVPYFTNHELRHSYGSNLLNDGFDIKFVSEQMGHESIAVTLSVYHHLLQKAAEENKRNYYNNY